MRHGFVLPVSLILLLVLSLVATGAIRASGQESHLAGNAVERAEAFETSESVRRLFEPILHAALDGDAAVLTTASATGWTLVDPTGLSLSSNDDENAHCATPFAREDGTPCQLRVDATYQRNVAAAGEPAMILHGEIAVFRLRTADDGTRYFYVESRGDSSGDPRRSIRVVTAAVVRHAPPAEGTLTPNQNGEIDWRERRP